MPSTKSLRLRLRLVALVALLVAFDAVFVTVAYWLAHFAVGIGSWAITYEASGFVGQALRFETLPSPLVLAVGTVLTLAVQSMFGYRMSAQTVPGEEQSLAELLSPVTERLRSDTDTDSGRDFRDFGGLLADRSHAMPTDADEDGDDGLDERVVPAFDYSEVAGRVQTRLTGLAQLSDAPIPDVTVVESDTPNSYVAGRPGQQTLVVTTGLLETLDGDELDAVLAHELAHLKHGDAFVMTAAGFLPTITKRVNDGVVTYFRHSMLALLPWIEQDEDANTFSAGQFEVALLVLAPITLALSSVLWFTSTACYRLLSRVREFHADAGGATIAGSPAALAGALETLDDRRPAEDLRIAQTGVRELCVLPDAIGDEDGALRDDGLGRLRRRWRTVTATVLPSSHPSIESRVDALGDRERADRR